MQSLVAGGYTPFWYAQARRWQSIMQRVYGTIFVFVGAIAGAALGYVVFFWLIRKGYYGLAIPGGLLGLGAGIGRGRGVWPPVVCGLAALGLGLIVEWRYAPFADDPGFVYFLRHVTDLKPVTLVMIAVGAAVGFWVPFRRRELPQ
ncbi:MAG: hypothetical protein ACT4QC_03335 [Planctomycetaceae bacterium]